MSKNTDKNMPINLSGKYSHTLLDHTKQSVTNALKTTSKTVIQKTAEATGNLVGDKVVDAMMKVPKTSQQNNSETVTNENDKEIPKERYISQWKTENYCLSEINIIT